MPASTSSASTRGVWASQPKASTPNRWTRVVRPPVQSRWCMLRAWTPADEAVMVEDGLAVGGEPDVALEPGGAQPQGEGEGLEGVLRRMGTRTAMSECVR